MTVTGSDPGVDGLAGGSPRKISARSLKSPAGLLRWVPYLAPALVLSGLFVAYPAIDAVRVSLFNWPGYGPSTWAGLSNYSHLLSDSVFRGSVVHSLIFAGVVTALSAGIGTAMALAFDRRLPGRGIFQFLVFLPVILPNTFIAAAWLTGLNQYTGWATAIFHLAGPRGAPQAWLGTSAAVYVVAAVAVLQQTGFPMIVVRGALSEIPLEIQEAATLEGTEGWQRARRISLPLVRDVIVAVAMLQWVWNFAAFDYIFVMTNGGPGGASEVTSTFVYHQAFTNREFGYAAAAAVASSLFVAVVVMIYFAAFRPRGVERRG